MESKICLTGTMFAWCIDELLVDSKLWSYLRPTFPYPVSGRLPCFRGEEVSKVRIVHDTLGMIDSPVVPPLIDLRPGDSR